MSQELFQYVKKTLFPQWGRIGEWSFEEVEGLEPLGAYDRKRRVIQMRKGQTTQDRELLIVKQICLALTPGFYSDSWAARMEKAAVSADKRGNPYLASAIRVEVEEMMNSADLLRCLLRTATH